MENGYPAFAALFPHLGGRTHLYISLLRLETPEAVEAVEEVPMAAQRSSELDKELSALLDGINWRPHVVAATAIALGYGSEPSIEKLWSTFDRGSWATPQLAVAASLRDAEFELKAQSRIDGWHSPRSGSRASKALSALISLFALIALFISGRLAERIWALAGALDPKALSGSHDPKALSALIYLCSLRPSCSPWLADVTTVAAIEEALAYDRLWDRGDRLAEDWLARITEIMRKP